MSEQNESAVTFPTHTRPHIALAVADLERARAFYRALLDVEPAKVRPGYVKFEAVEPPLNLTLNEAPAVAVEAAPAHFGVQVKSRRAVAAASARMSAAGYPIEAEDHVTCCFAVQDKVWAIDPDGRRWEVFVVLDADAATYAPTGSTCCAPSPTGDACCDAPEQASARTGCC